MKIKQPHNRIPQTQGERHEIKVMLNDIQRSLFALKDLVKEIPQMQKTLLELSEMIKPKDKL